MKRRGDVGIVYSTDQGRTCPGCNAPVESCTCTKKRKRETTSASTMPGDGVVRIRREVKGRKGKGVTTIHGLSLPAPDLKTLATELKRLCGTGGSVKDGVIEIQGDRRDLVRGHLVERGYTVKLAGG